MDKLFLDTKRTGYATDQCGETLTVGELIEVLSQYDEDTPVYYNNDDGYTFGEISENYIHVEEGSDEDC